MGDPISEFGVTSELQVRSFCGRGHFKCSFEILHMVDVVASPQLLSLLRYRRSFAHSEFVESLDEVLQQVFVKRVLGENSPGLEVFKHF